LKYILKVIDPTLLITQFKLLCDPPHGNHRMELLVCVFVTFMSVSPEQKIIEAWNLVKNILSHPWNCHPLLSGRKVQDQGHVGLLNFWVGDALLLFVSATTVIFQVHLG